MRINWHDQKSNTNRPTLALTYHPFSTRVKNIIYKHFNILRSNRVTNSLFPAVPLTAWRRDTSLRDMVVHTEQHGLEVNAGSFPCDRTRCGTCRFIINTNHVFGPKNSVPVTSRFTCISTNVVYCITCQKCGFLYIGSTVRRLGDRFVEHLRLTRQKNRNYPVYMHFYVYFRNL